MHVSVQVIIPISCFLRSMGTSDSIGPHCLARYTALDCHFLVSLNPVFVNCLSVKSFSVIPIAYINCPAWMGTVMRVLQEFK